MIRDVGRFINQDPYLGESTTPPSLHRYLYAYSNPTYYIDRNGHCVDAATGELATGPSMCGHDGSWVKGAIKTIANEASMGMLYDDGTLYSPGSGGYNKPIMHAGGKDLADMEKFQDNSLVKMVQAITAVRNVGKIVKEIPNALKSAKDSYNKLKGKFTTEKNDGPTNPSTPRNNTDSAANNDCVCINGCFAAGTPILTITGLKAIEELEVGELVASKDEITGDIDWRPVVNVFIFNGRPIYELIVENADGIQETVVVTDDHPYRIVGRGWVKSIDLLPGMIALDYDGREIEIISLVDLEVRKTTYNIEVEEFHTFFVGELRTWVHNQNKLDILKTKKGEVTVDSIGEARALIDDLVDEGFMDKADDPRRY